MKLKTILFSFGLFAFAATSAGAAVTSDRDEWEDAVGDFSVTSNFGDLYTNKNAVSLGGTTATSIDSLQVLKVSSGWNTGTWVQKYSGQLLFSNYRNTITLVFDKYITGFSFLAAPNLYGTSQITLSAGGETLTQDVTTTLSSGSGAYFGWFGSAISSLTISASSGGLGLAIGKIGVSSTATPVAVPGPEAGAGLGVLAMGGLAFWMSRRRKQAVAA